MSKFATSDRTAARDSTASAWVLLQTLWVGGIWTLHFLVLPGLASVGLASLLIEEVARTLVPQMVGITLGAVLLQAVLLVRLPVLSFLLLRQKALSPGVFQCLHGSDDHPHRCL